MPGAAGGWQPKPCELLVQAVSLDDEGIPTGMGSTIAAARLDLSQFCGDQEVLDPDHAPDPLVLPLLPAGTLTLRVSSRWLRDWVADANDAASDTSLALTPATSSASLCPEESVASLCGDDATAPSTAAPSPLPPRRPSVHDDAEDADGGCTPITGSAVSSALTRSVSTGSGHSDAATSASALARRCKRLARERDEARTEAFAEASVAVQRGIEVDNLSEFWVVFSLVSWTKNCLSRPYPLTPPDSRPLPPLPQSAPKTRCCSAWRRPSAS